MNKRIEELSKQSGLDIYGLGLDRNKWDTTVSKFAELIIKECIAQVELELGTRGQLLSGGPPTNAGVYYACGNIRRHFGVE